MNKNIVLKNRKRFISKKTNYYTRYKMLKNYEKIYRLTFEKKNHYCLSGLYKTLSPEVPDKAEYYSESRYFNLKTNLLDTYEFGKIVGKDLSEKFSKKALDLNRVLVLDLRNHKKINYSNFIKGVTQTLNPAINRAF